MACKDQQESSVGCAQGVGSMSQEVCAMLYAVLCCAVLEGLVVAGGSRESPGLGRGCARLGLCSERAVIAGERDAGRVRASLLSGGGRGRLGLLPVSRCCRSLCETALRVLGRAHFFGGCVVCVGVSGLCGVMEATTVHTYSSTQYIHTYIHTSTNTHTGTYIPVHTYRYKHTYKQRSSWAGVAIARHCHASPSSTIIIIIAIIHK
jgi:hypothetical protein